MDSQIYNFLAIIKTAIRGQKSKLKEPNWEKILAYADSHNIVPLVFEGCSKYASFSNSSEEIRKKYFEIAINKISRQINRTQVFLDIYDKLCEAGIKPLVLKGFVCRSLYGELADLRPSKDEDIYIKVGELERCRNVLEQNGFVMKPVKLTDELLSTLSEIVFIHNSGFQLEVHIRLLRPINEVNIRMNSFFKDVFENCICNEINGHKVYTMNHTKYYLYLFIHLYKHFIYCGIGIRQIVDLLLYGERYYEEIEWGIVERHINNLRAGRLYADILRLGSKYFGINLKCSYSSCLSHNTFNALIYDIMNAGVFGKATLDRKFGANITTSALKYGKVRFMDVIFPKKSSLMHKYKLSDINRRQTFLLRVMRILKFLANDFSFSLAYKSLVLGRRRIRLLKNYGIIN